MRQRTLPAMAAAAVLMLALTACSGNSPEAATGENNTPTATASPVPTESASPTASSKPADESGVIKGSGTYVGQIDNHSVEIKTEEGPTAFELGAGTETAVESLELDDPVVFEYVEKSVAGDDTVKQRVLSKLSKADSVNEPSIGAVLPQTKKLKLSLEGNVEEKTAKLASGDGYSLYVFDLFTFDAGSNKLAMIIDNNYHAEIIKLPSDYNLDYLLLEGKEELASTGEVKVLKESERPELMSDASLYLLAGGSDITKEYIVKEIDGQGFIFKINTPMGEPSEGFVPHVLASLNSVVNQ
jgi:hypothetical protein